MSTRIGVIDDNDAQRGTVKGFLDDTLPSGWDVIDSRPPTTLRGGLDWVNEKEIAVLLVDEKLNQSMNIDYSGHQLATAIRLHRPDFPVFVVTSFADDDDLLDAEADVDAIVNREAFTKKPEVYANRLTRAGTRYVKQHEKDLARLSELSSRIAMGTASGKDFKEARALQAALQLRFFDQLEGTATVPVDELRDALSQAEALRKDIQASLRKKPKGKVLKGKRK